MRTILSVLTLIISINCIAQEQSWKLEYDTIVPVIYENEWEEVEAEFFFVVKDFKWGLSDTTGKIIVPPVWEYPSCGNYDGVEAIDVANCEDGFFVNELIFKNAIDFETESVALYAPSGKKLTKDSARSIQSRSVVEGVREYLVQYSNGYEVVTGEGEYPIDCFFPSAPYFLNDRTVLFERNQRVFRWDSIIGVSELSKSEVLNFCLKDSFGLFGEEFDDINDTTTQIIILHEFGFNNAGDYAMMLLKQVISGEYDEEKGQFYVDEFDIDPCINSIKRELDDSWDLELYPLYYSNPMFYSEHNVREVYPGLFEIETLSEESGRGYYREYIEYAYYTYEKGDLKRLEIGDVLIDSDSLTHEVWRELEERDSLPSIYDYGLDSLRPMSFDEFDEQFRVAFGEEGLTYYQHNLQMDDEGEGKSFTFPFKRYKAYFKKKTPVRKMLKDGVQRKSVF